MNCVLTYSIELGKLVKEKNLRHREVLSTITFMNTMENIITQAKTKWKKLYVGHRMLII